MLSLSYYPPKHQLASTFLSSSQHSNQLDNLFSFKQFQNFEFSTEQRFDSVIDYVYF